MELSSGFPGTIAGPELPPFRRLSRVLTTLLLLRAGYAYVPYSSLENVIEQTKENYYIALRNSQDTIRSEAPDWQPWVAYFLRALQQQKNRLAIKLERESALIGQLPELSTQILELAKDHGRLVVRDIVKITGANRNTVKKHLRDLVAAKYLSQHGIGKGTWYSAA